MRRLALMACVGAGLFLLVGCQTDSSTQGKSDKLCVELGKLDGAITQMTAATVDPSAANVAKFRQLRDQLPALYSNVEKAAKDVRSYKIDGVTTTYNNFVKTVAGVNDAAALTAKHAEIDGAAGEFSTARLESYDAGQCS